MHKRQSDVLAVVYFGHVCGCRDSVGICVRCMESVLSKARCNDQVFAVLLPGVLQLDVVLFCMTVQAIATAIDYALHVGCYPCLYAQMTSYVSIDNLSAGLSQVAGAIASVLSMRIPQSGSSSSSTSGGICVMETLSAVSKVQLSAMVPFAVAGAMLIILMCTHLWSRWRSSRPLTALRTDSISSLHSALLDRTEDREAIDVAVSIQAHHSDASTMSYRSRLIAAGVNFGLTAYSAFVTVVVQMLHCVSTPSQHGASSRLFIQGTVSCDLGGWQVGYVIGLALLVVVPLGLILLSRWSLRIKTTSSGSLKDDARLGVARALYAPYVSEHAHYWESVLMTHRFALALLFTFATSMPVIQSGLRALITSLMLLLHVYNQPMRGTDSQMYQTVLLVCLLLVTMSKDFESSLLQVASPLSDTSATDYAAVITLLFGYVVPLVGVLVCFREDIRGAVRKLCSRCRKTEA